MFDTRLLDEQILAWEDHEVLLFIPKICRPLAAPLIIEVDWTHMHNELWLFVRVADNFIDEKRVRSLGDQEIGWARETPGEIPKGKEE